jgi:hypothetical protein
VKFFDSSRRRAIEDFRAYASERSIAFSDLDAIEENARHLSILDPPGRPMRYFSSAI